MNNSRGSIVDNEREERIIKVLNDSEGTTLWKHQEDARVRPDDRPATWLSRQGANADPKGTRCGSPRATKATLPSRDFWLCPSLLFPGFVAVSSLRGGFTLSRTKRAASDSPSLLADMDVIGMEPIEPYSRGARHE